MKSLNRTLSLVLVLAMVFGLMGVASAATPSFSDNATIQYQTAVGTMVGMGAINGYTDGTFKPTGTITREEAAKLVTYAVLGADVAKTLTVSSTGFKDVASDRWSAPFITYLVGKGVINGLGDGTFNPTGNVTGFELAKMLLCTAGYGKQGEYTGASWALNVAVDANKLGVFTGSKAASFNVAATREEAALYCFNAITKIEKAVWNKNTESYSPADGTVAVDNTIAIATYTYSAQAAAAITAVTYSATKGYTVATVGSYTIPADFSAVGTKVVVHGNATTGKIFYVQTTTKTIDLSNMKASAYKAAVYTSGIAAATAATIPVYNNFYAGAAAALPANTTSFVGADAKLITETNSTTGVTSAVAIQYRTRTLDSVTAVSALASAESVTFTTLGTKSTAAASKVVFGDTVAKGDVVLVTSINAGAAYVVEKAKSVTGAVSAVNTSAADGTYVTVGGTSYWASGVLAGTTTGVSYSGIPSTSSAVQYTFYLDNFGDVMGYTPVTAASTSYDLAVVADMDHVATGSGFGVTTYKYVAQVLFADGTYGVYEIASYNGKAVVETVTSASSQIDYATVNAAAVGYKLYNASLDASGKVVLKTLATYGAGFTPAVASGSLTSPQIIKGNAIVGTGDYATANTLYFYHSGTFGASNFVYAVYKGFASASTLSGAPTVSDVATYTVSGTEYVAAVAYTGTPADATSVDVYYYDGAYTTVVSGATTTVTYKLYKNGVAEDYSVATVGAYTPVAQVAKGFYVKKAITTSLSGLASYTTNTKLNQSITGYASNIMKTAASEYYTTDTTVVVDLRTATQIATSSATYGVGAVSSVAQIAAAKAVGCTLNYQVLYSVGGTLALDGTAAKPWVAQYIYVTAPSSVATLDSATVNTNAATLYSTADLAAAGTKVALGTAVAITVAPTTTAVDATVAYSIEKAYSSPFGATAFVNGTTLTSATANTDVLQIIVTAADGSTATYYVGLAVS